MSGKSFFAAALALMAAASCNRSLDVLAPESSDVKLVPVKINVSLEGTKAVFDGVSKASWEKGDTIAIGTTDLSGQTYKLVTYTGGTNAVFEGLLPDGMTEAKAFYPVSNILLNPTTGTGNYNFKARFPQVQYGINAGIDVESMTMGTYTLSIKDSLCFHQVCGMFKVNVAGNDVTKITLSLGKGTAGDYVWGENCHVNLSTCNTSVTNGTKSGNQITLVPKTGSTFTPGAYYFSVVGKTDARTFSGVTVSFFKGNRKFVKSSSNEVSFKRGDIINLNVSENDCAEVFQEAKVKVGDTSTSLTMVEENLYEGKVSIPATGSFSIELEGKTYGFAKYSGGGGLGTVNNEFSAIPYYSVSTISDVKKSYYIRKAMGTMSDNDSEPFWLNLPEGGQMFVRVDNTGSTPTYYIKLVEAEDPNLVYEQNFDLVCWGGEYNGGPGCIGSDPGTAKDPYIICTKGGIAYTSLAYNGFYYAPDAEFKDLGKDYYSEGTSIMTDEFMNAIEAEGWYFPYAMGFRPMCIQAGAASTRRFADFYTPRLSKLTSATDVKIEMDLTRLANKSLKTLTVTIDGPGTFTAGSVMIDGNETPRNYTDFGTGNKAITVVQDAYLPKTENATKNKPVSHFTFYVSGATSQTRIVVLDDHSTDNSSSSNGRVQIFKYKVTKQ